MSNEAPQFEEMQLSDAELDQVVGGQEVLALQALQVSNDAVIGCISRVSCQSTASCESTVSGKAAEEIA